MRFTIAALALTLQMILPEVASAQLVTPDPDGPVTALRQRAAVIYQRLTGVKVGLDAPILVQMEARLAANDPIGAAELVTGDSLTNNLGEPNFYDTTVRQMAAKMSTREESVKAPLSDFVATFIGIVRDEADGRDLLKGSYYYAGTATAVPNNQNVVADIIKSNNHYAALDRSPASLRDAIERRPVQQVANSANAAVTNPDPAGVLTSRAFTEAHAIAGTNRRMVHYSFKQFLCIDMQGWATTDAPDNRVGPDVERAPGGDPATFQNTCKGCHGNMDGLRGAFANIDFSNNHLEHGLVLNNQNNNGVNSEALNDTVFASASFASNGVTTNYPGVASKYIRNAVNAPGAHFTTDASWINTATKGANAIYFGWRSTKNQSGNITGYGINQYGTMLADSEAFSRCMVRRVYQQVCKRDISASETKVIRDLAGEFEKDRYNFKKLFQKVAVNEACIGK